MNASLTATDTTISTSTIKHVTVRTGLPYWALVIAFEKELGHWDQQSGTALVARKASWGETQATIGAMAGHQGLMIFTRINQGEIASLSGFPRSSSLYLVGNPIIATDILDIDIRGGFLVPFRVELYEADGNGMLAYDLPSSFLASLGTAGLSEIGISLDAKIESVARALSQPA